MRSAFDVAKPDVRDSGNRGFLREETLEEVITCAIGLTLTPSS
jgi:hypothetical protein